MNMLKYVKKSELNKWDKIYQDRIAIFLKV